MAWRKELRGRCGSVSRGRVQWPHRVNVRKSSAQSSPPRNYTNEQSKLLQQNTNRLTTFSYKYHLETEANTLWLIFIHRTQLSRASRTQYNLQSSTHLINSKQKPSRSFLAWRILWQDLMFIIHLLKSFAICLCLINRIKSDSQAP